MKGMNQMGKCADCEGDAVPKEAVERGHDLCPACTLDRILNDLMNVRAVERAKVVGECLAYPGTADIIRVGVIRYGN